MTTMVYSTPRENNVKKVIETMTNQRTEAANGTNTAGQSADSDRLSNIFNVLLKGRTPAKSNQDKLIDSEREKRGLAKAMPARGNIQQIKQTSPFKESTGSEDKTKRISGVAATRNNIKSPFKEDTGAKPMKKTLGEGDLQKGLKSNIAAGALAAGTGVGLGNVRQKILHPEPSRAEWGSQVGQKVQGAMDKYNTPKALQPQKPTASLPAHSQPKPTSPVSGFSAKVNKSEVPTNTGDKEKEKTEKPANQEKMLKCIQMAKKFKDPTVGYEAESNKVRADQQKSDKVGAVLGREPIKTTEPIQKSDNKLADWVKLNAIKKKGVEIIPSKGDKIKPDPVKKSEEKKTPMQRFNEMKKKGFAVIPSKGDKIKPDESIRISQTKTEAGLKKAQPTLDYRQINPPKRPIPPPTKTLDYSKDTRPIDSTTGSVKPLNNPYQHSSPKASLK